MGTSPLPNLPTTTTDAVHTAVQYGQSALGPLGQLIPQSAMDTVTKSMIEQADKPGWFGDFIKSILGCFKDLTNWFNGLFTDVRAAIDQNSVTAEKGMLARIGLTPEGKAQGANPYSALDSKFGISVAADLQKFTADTISASVQNGALTDKAEVAKAIVAYHTGARDIIYSALIQKFGKDEKDEERILALADQLATSYSNITGERAKSQNPAMWLEKNPPTGGFAAMILGANSAYSKAPKDGLNITQISAFTSDESTLTSVASALSNPAAAQAAAAAATAGQQRLAQGTATTPAQQPLPKATPAPAKAVS